MSEKNYIAGLQALLLMYGEASLKSPPDDGEMRLPDAQTKPWKALGISRATWYRQGKPEVQSQLRNRGYWRQKVQAEAFDRSVRSVQRQFFVFRYGIPELRSLAQHERLPFAMLEEIARWEHDDQRRFADQLQALAVDLPKSFKPKDGWRKQFSPFENAVLPVRGPELKRAAKRAFDSTLMEMVMREDAP